MFPDADAVDDYVIFNLRRTRYRIITVTHYSREMGVTLTAVNIYIRSLLTHKEHDNRNNCDKEFGTK
ncbi:type II toxin-antitoxin system HigB family toxin [Edaphobacter aggregans]|uniref:type II toxin-antitoxin system HigB family toxin n=1 Tax=Edaphobacter aggregans TaxID=570835 RepID=UPI000558ABCB